MGPAANWISFSVSDAEASHLCRRQYPEDGLVTSSKTWLSIDAEEERALALIWGLLVIFGYIYPFVTDRCSASRVNSCFLRSALFSFIFSGWKTCRVHKPNMTASNSLFKKIGRMLNAGRGTERSEKGKCRFLSLWVGVRGRNGWLGGKRKEDLLNLLWPTLLAITEERAPSP